MKIWRQKRFHLDIEMVNQKNQIPIKDAIAEVIAAIKDRKQT